MLFQNLSIFSPEDGVTQIGPRNVHGAVEGHLVALRQSDCSHGGFEVKLSELFRGQIHSRHCGWYHTGLFAAVDVAAGMLSCLQLGG